MAYITNPKTPNTHKTHTPPTYHVVFHLISPRLLLTLLSNQINQRMER